MVPKLGASQLIFNSTTPITFGVPQSPVAVNVRLTISGQLFEKD